MQRWNRILVTFFLPYSLLFISNSSLAGEDYCLSHREFITTLEYMRKQDFYKMGEQHARDVAHAVSKGCTGAAKRFVRVYELLVKVEAGARSSAQFAIEMSKHTDAHVDTFMGIFKNAYSPDKLDLDALSSVAIARRLSSDYKGDVRQALKDYENLVSFCRDDDQIGGSAAQCAILASDLAQAGENHSRPISQSFIKLYKYLRSAKQTGVSVNQAIQLAKSVVSTHPEATENFISAYEYGLKNTGLDLPADQSLSFAMKIAQRSITPALNAENSRIPASTGKKLETH